MTPPCIKPAMAVAFFTLLLLSQLNTPARAWSCGTQECLDCVNSCRPPCMTSIGGSTPPIYLSESCFGNCINDRCQALQQVPGQSPQCVAAQDSQKCEACVNDCFMTCYKLAGKYPTLRETQSCATSCAGGCALQ